MAGIGFYTGALALPDLINKICDELLAVSGSSWSEPDGSGDWITDTTTAGHRALKYTNGDEVIYITFEVIKGGRTMNWGTTANDGVEVYHFVQTNTYSVSGKGLRFGYSAGWDELNHQPSGSWMQTFIAYYERYSVSASGLEDWRCTGDLDTAPIDYWLWIEDNGFALMGNPEHQSQNDKSGALILICERNPNKEYNDGMPYFYTYARQSCTECNGSRSNINYEGLRHECVLRPWSYRASTQKEFYADPNTDVVKGLNWEIQWMDTATSHTSNGMEFLDIRNCKVTRYKQLGTGEATVPIYVPNIDTYDSVIFDSTYPQWPAFSEDFPDGIDVGLQIAWSENDSTYTDFMGPGGFDTWYYRKVPNYNNEGSNYIETPGGYTGKYIKWKFALFSDGRDTPILDGFLILAWLYNYQKELTVTATTYPVYGSANPVMTVPLGLEPSTIPSSLINFPTGVELTTVDWLLIDTLAGVHIDLLSGIDRYAKFRLSVSSWLESVVGQVVSGYVRDQNENIILNGFKVIITSTYAFGLDSMGTVDPPTGFYQLFIKSTIYDNRWLMATLNTGKTFDIAYRKYGLPALIDGTAPLVSPQDMHFWVPSQICGKSVAYVGSLVTY